MSKHITVKAQGDHVQHWAALKRLYIPERGSDPGKSGKAIPRTTNGDVAALTRLWDTEFRREILRNPFVNDRSRSSMTRWDDSKRAIQRDLANADKHALYPRNEWFWDTATLRLAIYLESRKAIPSNTELWIESFTETLSEHADTAKRIAKGAADAVSGAGRDLLSTLKTGALILGGLVGAAIAVPPIIRALRD